MEMENKNVILLAFRNLLCYVGDVWHGRISLRGTLPSGCVVMDYGAWKFAYLLFSITCRMSPNQMNSIALLLYFLDSPTPIGWPDYSDGFWQCFPCRKSLLLATAILAAGGAAAYMQPRLRHVQIGSVGCYNGAGNLTETSEDGLSNPTFHKEKKLKKSGVRSLQVLAAILLSQMGRRGACDVLTLVGILVSFFIHFLTWDLDMLFG